VKRVLVIVLRYVDTNQPTYSTLSSLNMSGVCYGWLPRTSRDRWNAV